MHRSAHERLIEMLIELGIEPEASCSAATPADIQLMVRSGYGVALIDQKTVLDADLTTRQSPASTGLRIQGSFTTARQIAWHPHS